MSELISPSRARVSNPFASLDVAIGRGDRMRWWTWLSGGGLAAAALLALVGGFPFDMPMPTHRFGWVEPSCGLTRGSTALARGEFGLGWRYNPASFGVVAFGLAGLIRAVIGIVFGRWLHVSIHPHLAGRLVLAAAVIALWFYQQTNAEFIINSRL